MCVQTNIISNSPVFHHHEPPPSIVIILRSNQRNEIIKTATKTIQLRHSLQKRGNAQIYKWAASYHSFKMAKGTTEEALKRTEPCLLIASDLFDAFFVPGDDCILIWHNEQCHYFSFFFATCTPPLPFLFLTSIFFFWFFLFIFTFIILPLISFFFV